MKILILSFYYYPDLSAGSFRTTALVKSLLQQLPDATDIELITTQPNRYSSFTSEALAIEVCPRLVINRIALPSHKSGMYDQAKAFLVYANQVRKIVKGKKYVLIYATSSRLMTACLGAIIARQHGTPLYLDIRDIFVDTIKEVLPKKLSWIMVPLFSSLEAFTIKAAKKINLVSAGFLSYFKNRYPDKNYSTFTNGIDNEFMQLPLQIPRKNISNQLQVVYAGNIGEGQGLQNIVPQLAKRFEGKIHFRIVGDGGRLLALKNRIIELGCNNIELSNPVSRQELIDIYQTADILFLHLNDYDAFRKVLPSKIFEYAALGKPIWAGVAGYAAEFIMANIKNAVVFPPLDVEGAVTSLRNLQIHTAPRNDFVTQFSRTNIMREMAKDIEILTQVD